MRLLVHILIFVQHLYRKHDTGSPSSSHNQRINKRRQDSQSTFIIFLLYDVLHHQQSITLNNNQIDATQISVLILGIRQGYRCKELLEISTKALSTTGITRSILETCTLPDQHCTRWDRIRIAVEPLYIGIKNSNKSNIQTLNKNHITQRYISTIA